MLIPGNVAVARLASTMSRSRGVLSRGIVLTVAGVSIVGCDAYFRVEGTVVAGEREAVEIVDSVPSVTQGEAQDADEPALEGVRVRFEHARGTEETSTDATGRFVVEGTTSHLWSVEMEFSLRGFRTIRYPVKPPMALPTRVRVILEPAPNFEAETID